MRFEIFAPQWALVVIALFFCAGIYAGWKAGAFWVRSNAEMGRQAAQKEINGIRDQQRQERETMQQRHQVEYNRLWAELVALKKGAVPSQVVKTATKPSVVATATVHDGDETRTPIEPVPAPVRTQQRGMPRSQGVPHIDRDDDLER